MKNLLRFFVFTFIVIASNACDEPPEKPEKVAEQFLNHFYKKEFSEAKNFASIQSWSSIDMIERHSKQKKDTIKKNHIENIKCDIVDDKATCVYYIEQKETKIDLKKIEGKWLVVIYDDFPELKIANLEIEKQNVIVAIEQMKKQDSIDAINLAIYNKSHPTIEVSSTQKFIPKGFVWKVSNLITSNNGTTNADCLNNTYQQGIFYVNGKTYNFYETFDGKHYMSKQVHAGNPYPDTHAWNAELYKDFLIPAGARVSTYCSNVKLIIQGSKP